MRRNTKGFTLIELLAVIVVLAIIALIATPIVLNLINDAKKGAAVQSANAYIKAAETAVMVNMVDTKQTFVLCNEYKVKDANGVLTPADNAKAATDGKSDCSTLDVTPKISGKTPALNGTISFDENGTVSGANLEIDGFKDILYSASTGAYKKS